MDAVRVGRTHMSDPLGKVRPLTARMTPTRPCAAAGSVSGVWTAGPMIGLAVGG